MSRPPSSAGSSAPTRRVAQARLAGLVLGLAAAFVLVLVLVGHDRDAIGRPPALLFVAVMAVLTCAFFPFPIMAAVAGLLFGTAGGTALSLAGGTLGALMAFAIARRGGAAPVAALAGERLRGLLATVGERGFSTVLLLRAFPGLPRDIVNYVCGLTPVRVRDYAAATVLGTAPRAYAYTALGGSLGDLGSVESIVAVGVLAAMALLGLVLFRRSGSGAATSSPDDRSAAPR